MRAKRKKIKLVSLTTVVFALYPVLADMVVGNGFSMSNICLLLLMVMSIISILLSKLITISIYEKLLLIIGCIGFCSTIISVFYYNISFPFEYWCHLVGMYIIICFYRKKLFKASVYWSLTYFFGLILGGIIFLQEIQLNLLGSFITFTPNAQLDRVAAVYSEPAHYILFQSTIIISSLLEVDCLEISENKRILYSVIISLSIVLSSSSTGIVYLAFIWCGWLLYSKKLSKKFIFIIIGTILIVVFYTQGDWLKFSIEHFKDMDFRRITSGSFRLARGFAVYGKINIFQKIIGIGSGVTKDVIKRNGIITLYDGLENIGSDYVSTLSAILLDTGIIGFALFIVLISSFIIRCDKKGRFLVGMYLLYIVSNEIIYTPQLIIPLFLILENIRQVNENYTKGNDKNVKVY